MMVQFSVIYTSLGLTELRDKKKTTRAQDVDAQ